MEYESNPAGLKTLLCAVFVSILFAGCHNEKSGEIPPHVQALENVTIIPSDFLPQVSIQFVMETAFKDSLVLENIPAVAVHEDGTLFMGGESWNRSEIYIFEYDGSHQATLGGYGEGAGEFLEINGLQIRGNQLFVFDGVLQRITVFDTESGLLKDTLSIRKGHPVFSEDQDEIRITPFRSYPDGSFLVQVQDQRNPAYYPERKVKYYSMGKDGKLDSDFIFEQKGANYLVGDYAGRPAPFKLLLPEQSLSAIGADGRFYSAWTEEFLIRIFDAEGSYVESWYIPFERAPLSREEVIHPRFSHNDQILRIRESATYPKEWPALYSMLVDEKERVWISSITEDKDVFEWWVVDSGQLYTRFYWPREKEITFVKNGHIYTIEDNKNGFKEVVRYRFEIN